MGGVPVAVNPGFLVLHQRSRSAGSAGRDRLPGTAGRDVLAAVATTC